MKVIACIEDHHVIKKILDHLMDKAGTPAHTSLITLSVQAGNQYLFRITAVRLTDSIITKSP